MFRFGALALVLVAILGLISCNNPVREKQALTVSAAADLSSAFGEIRILFEKRTDIVVRYNFGSTGQLAQQIEQGAPVDLFAAADSSFIDQLEAKGLIVAGSRRLYGGGRLTLWTRSDTQLDVRSLSDLVKPEVKRIAIANPRHAPYGVAAREALQALDLWTRVEPRLVFGENIRQTMQYAESGNVDVAIGALSLSTGSGGKWALVPEELHRPLDQTLAIIKGTHNPEGAREFADFVTGEGHAVMRKYGFLLPGEGSAK